MGEKFERVKQHVKDNWQVYTAAGIGLLVGSAVTSIVITRNMRMAAAFSEIEIGAANTVSQGIAINSPVTITNDIIQAKMHPGFITRCLETGHDFASRREAAQMMGLSAKDISEQIKGHIPDVNGYHFADGGINLNGLK